MPPPTISELMQVPNGYSTANQTMSDAMDYYRKQQLMRQQMAQQMQMQEYYINQRAYDRTQSALDIARGKQDIQQNDPERIAHQKFMDRYGVGLGYGNGQENSQSQQLQAPIAPPSEPVMPDRSAVSANFNPIMGGQGYHPTLAGQNTSVGGINFNPMNPVAPPPQQVSPQPMAQGKFGGQGDKPFIPKGYHLRPDWVEFGKGDKYEKDTGGMGNISPDLEGINPLSENATKEEKDQWLAQLPKGDAALVKGLTDYSLDIKGAISQRSNARQKYAALAQMYDPTFSMPDYTARQKYLTSLKSGNLNNQILKINTVIGHLGSLQKAYENLHSGNYPLLNSVGQFGATATGSGAPAKVDYAANAVANEMESVFRMTGGNLEGIRAWKSGTPTNASPDQQKQVINGAVELLASRLDAIEANHKKVMGKDRDFSILNDKSIKVLQKLGVNPSALDPVLMNEQSQFSQSQIGNQGSVPNDRPVGATHYSPSTKQFYDAQGNVVQ